MSKKPPPLEHAQEEILMRYLRPRQDGWPRLDLESAALSDSCAGIVRRAEALAGCPGMLFHLISGLEPWTDARSLHRAGHKDAKAKHKAVEKAQRGIGKTGHELNAAGIYGDSTKQLDNTLAELSKERTGLERAMRTHEFRRKNAPGREQPMAGMWAVFDRLAQQRWEDCDSDLESLLRASGTAFLIRSEPVAPCPGFATRYEDDGYSMGNRIRAIRGDWKPFVEAVLGGAPTPPRYQFA